MRKGLLASAILLFGSAAWADGPADNAAAPEAPAPAIDVPAPTGAIACPPSVCDTPCDSACPERLWLSADYLLWWLKSQPAPGPLVTIGSAGDAVPGALGQPNTRVLYGNQNINENPYSGMRLGAGYWFGPERRFGIEGSYFLLEKQTQFYSAGSGPTGSPVIARPLTFVPGVQGSEVTSFPGELAGATGVAASTRLLGWETNVAFRAARQSNFTWDVIAGFRSLDLNENLTIHDRLIPLLPDGFLTFQGVANGVSPPSTMSDFDSFHTSNKFYGAQVGSRFDWRSGRLHANVLTKLALGTTQELVTINGSTSVVTPGAPTVTAPGGILAQPTNIGRYYRSEFGVVPEIGLNFGYQVTPRIEVLMGYTFLYWNSVVRPGNTVDRTVNSTQIPSDQSFTPGAAVPPRPAFGFNASDFWAQGINLSLAYRY